MPNLHGRAQLLALLGLLRSGCRSELEIWGHRHVFADPRLPPSRAQVPVVVAGRTAYLDRFFDTERVDVELDGAAWHRGDAQRERDIARDAALAARGLLVVRLSHRRLTSDPEAVRRELLAVLEVRRRQLGAA